MTHNTAKASANAQAIHPTTKSHCPVGAGLISSSSAPEGSHTPPQACAARDHDPAFQQASGAQAAQPAEGYKHSMPSSGRIDSRLEYSAEFRYFLFEPSAHDRLTYYKSKADRDSAAQKIIQSYCDEAWDSAVTGILAGEITHQCAQINLQHRPKDDQLDAEGFDSKTGRYWGDFESICNYELHPMQPKQAEPPVGIDSEGGSHD